ncbi:MAG: Clp protease N-terminal domain-containing protein, partial [Clostridia bacterium]|nr:Clp protease N-terminal domain-containing protein [Clostridia bacterium]
MFNDRLTERAREAISLAAESALELGQNYVGTEHLLVGLIREGEGVAGKILEGNGLTDDKVIDKIATLVGTGEPIPSGQPEATPRTKRVFEHSYIEARRLGHNYIGTEHLLIAMLREGESLAVRILVELGVQPQSLYNDIMQLLSENNEGGSDEPASQP